MAELERFALDPVVSPPTVLAGQAEDKLMEFAVGNRSRSTARRASRPPLHQPWPAAFRTGDVHDPGDGAAARTEHLARDQGEEESGGRPSEEVHKAVHEAVAQALPGQGMTGRSLEPGAPTSLVWWSPIQLLGSHGLLPLRLQLLGATVRAPRPAQVGPAAQGSRSASRFQLGADGLQASVQFMAMCRTQAAC